MNLDHNLHGGSRIAKAFTQPFRRTIPPKKSRTDDLVMEMVSVYRLDWDDLKNCLRIWFPRGKFPERVSVNNNHYVIYLPVPLNNAQREEINRLRDGKTFNRELTPET